MRLSRVVCWLFASLTIISLAPSAIAQQDQDFETGLNPYRTYQTGNIDSIDVLNRSLNVDIPLISYPQRGDKLHLDFDLHYINQGNWFNCTPGTNCSGYYGSGPALINGFGVILKDWPSSWGTTCQSTGDQYGDWTCQGGATMFDGSSHSMLPFTVSNWESEDTSGLQLGGVFALGGGNTPPVLIDANGTQYTQPYAPSYFPGPVGGWSYLNYVPTLVEDANGNEITYSQTAGWTDTMGRAIPIPVALTPAQVTNPNTCPQVPLAPVAAYTWSLPGVSGGTYSLTFCYVYVPVTVNWDMQIQHKTEEELQTVILPNGTSWTFQYTSDGNGDLSQITFPTGGTLSYTWTTEDPLCAAYYYSNARAVVTRTLNPNDGVSPAGTWKYGYISNVVPVVTDPASNDTVHTFSSLITNACPYYETETQYYQGSHTSGTLLKTVSTKYQSLWSSSIFPTGLGQPSQTTSLWANGQENETAYSYDSALNFHAADYVSSTEFSTHMGGTYPPASYGLLETKKDYDYGNGAPGSLLRTTTTTYEALSNSNYLTNNMLALPASVAITGSGPGSTTTYAFDQTTPVSSGITTMHSSSPPGGTYRGNPTTVSRYLNTTGTYLNTTSTFFDTGMVHVVTDPKTNPTATYLYSPTYVGAYVTSVTNAANQTTTYAYDFNTGLLTSTTDPNNQTTSSTYDDMLRTTEINHPDGGVTTFTYQTAYQTEITEKMDTSGDNRISFIWVDGVGREGRVAVTNGETLGYDETVDICYNGLGQISFQGYPFQDGGWSAPRSCSIAGDSFTYDALSRNTKVSHFDGSAISTSYTGNAATVTDEQSKTRESFVDGLGRLEEVIENPGGLNYVTNYTHDALDDLTGVTQVSSHSRTFTYDSLARLTSAANPESGTVSYTYDSDGNVITRKDARSITTTYAYDALNRVTEKSYSDGTPAAFYYYDQTSWQNIVLTNTVGRLSYQGTYSTEWLTSSGFSYDPMGRVKNNSQCAIVECPSGPFSVTYGYDLIGDMTSYTNPYGTVFTQSFNAAGRVKQVTSSWSDSQHPATLVSGVHYNAAPGITAATLGNGLTGTSAYNGLLQPCRVNVNSSATVLSSCTAAVPSGNVLDLTFGFNYGSTDNGNVMSFAAVGAQTFNRSYTYDAANRIYTMSAPGDQCTGLQWTIDAWGNRTIQAATGGTCDAFNQPVGTNNNQFSNSSYQYDAAGNMLKDGVHTYAYDAENRISAVDGGSTASYTYDAQGGRAAKTVGSALTYYVRDLAGHVMSEYICQTCWNVGYVYLNGGLTAIYELNTTYFVHGDHLGSTRLMTAYPTPSVAECDDYYPFGELISCGSTGDTTHKFTGKERDTESNLDNFEARYRSSTLGRFMSPDPSGLALADPTDPQQLNLYSYVRNNPLALIDPDGLNCVWDDGSYDADDDPVTGSANGCAQQGGTWFANITGDWNSNPNQVLGQQAISSQLADQGICPEEDLCGTGSPNAATPDPDDAGDVESAPSAQAAMLAIHDAFERTFPDVCSVGANVRFGPGRVGVGIDANSSTGVRPIVRAQVAQLGPVSGSVSTREFGSKVSATGSVRIPDTPFSVGVSTVDATKISGVNAGVKLGPLFNATVYANIGQMYHCH